MKPGTVLSRPPSSVGTPETGTQVLSSGLLIFKGMALGALKAGHDRGKTMVLAPTILALRYLSAVPDIEYIKCGSNAVQRALHFTVHVQQRKSRWSSFRTWESQQLTIDGLMRQSKAIHGGARGPQVQGAVQAVRGSSAQQRRRDRRSDYSGESCLGFLKGQGMLGHLLYQQAGHCQSCDSWKPARFASEGSNLYDLWDSSPLSGASARAGEDQHGTSHGTPMHLMFLVVMQSLLNRLANQ